MSTAFRRPRVNRAVVEGLKAIAGLAEAELIGGMHTSFPEFEQQLERGIIYVGELYEWYRGQYPEQFDAGSTGSGQDS